FGETRSKLGLVSDRLFAHVVNSNLEVRTSVSINPETGAADSGKLFSYEAIPRDTWLFNDIIQDDYRQLAAGDSFKPISRQFHRDTSSENSDKAPALPGGQTWETP